MKVVQGKQDCIGKTVKAVQWGDNCEQVVIVFDDDTFFSLRSRRLEDDTELEMQTEFDTYDWQFPDLSAAFGEANARLMHQADVERREVARKRSREAEKARLQERLRQIVAGE
jgi:hypothetical protein